MGLALVQELLIGVDNNVCGWEWLPARVDDTALHLDTIEQFDPDAGIERVFRIRDLLGVGAVTVGAGGYLERAARQVSHDEAAHPVAHGSERFVVMNVHDDARPWNRLSEHIDDDALDAIPCLRSDGRSENKPKRHGRGKPENGW